MHCFVLQPHSFPTSASLQPHLIPTTAAVQFQVSPNSAALMPYFSRSAALRTCIARTSSTLKPHCSPTWSTRTHIALTPAGKYKQRQQHMSNGGQIQANASQGKRPNANAITHEKKATVGINYRQLTPLASTSKTNRTGGRTNTEEAQLATG